MDSYAEQIVKKSDGGSDNIKRMGILVGGVVLGLFLIMAASALRFGLIGMLLAVGVLYGAFYMSANYDVEYEYLVVNGEFSIDKIMAKKRRKGMLETRVSSFENFGIYTDDKADDETATIISAIGEGDYEVYYADFNHESHGRCRLLFTPSDKVLREIKPHLKGQLRQVLRELPIDTEK